MATSPPCAPSTSVLKNKLSEYVRLAEAGETVLVTDRAGRGGALPGRPTLNAAPRDWLSASSVIARMVRAARCPVRPLPAGFLHAAEARDDLGGSLDSAIPDARDLAKRSGSRSGTSSSFAKRRSLFLSQSGGLPPGRGVPPQLWKKTPASPAPSAPALAAVATGSEQRMPAHTSACGPAPVKAADFAGWSGASAAASAMRETERSR